MMGKKYVKFSYMLDEPCCNFDELELLSIDNDDIFDVIEFKDGFVILYCKESFNSQHNLDSERVEKSAENKLFSIFLEIVKESKAMGFSTHLDEINIADTRKLYMSSTISMGMSCSVNASIRRAEKSIIPEEENGQMLPISIKRQMEDLISNSSGNKYIQEPDKQRFIRLFAIKDPVIKYFILYSWLSELFPNQGQIAVNDFIVKSNTYSSIPDCFKNFTKRNGQPRGDGTYFTYLRNLMGHTVMETLKIGDEAIVQNAKKYTNWLIGILMEKLLSNSPHIVQGNP